MFIHGAEKMILLLKTVENFNHIDSQISLKTEGEAPFVLCGLFRCKPLLLPHMFDTQERLCMVRAGMGGWGDGAENTRQQKVVALALA